MSAPAGSDRLPQRPDQGRVTPDRFPGFDVTEQAGHWDRATAGVVLGRLVPPGPARFFAADEMTTARSLVGLLLDLGGARLDDVTCLVDARLADGKTDGWRYDDMPEDCDAWRESLRYLDKDARDLGGTRFADCQADVQREILERVRTRGPVGWHGRDASHLWSLWTRYACTAWYSHPSAWSEIGFPGPAFPRGYAHLGIDAREHHEAADVHPDSDPVASSTRP